LLVVAQAIPYGRSRTNPPIVAEPRWDSPMTRALARRACFDCHSNETQWPPYSRIAPVSWLVARDVQEGRAVLNFSEGQRPQEEAGEAAQKVTEGEMPVRFYTLVHPEARLSDAERAALARGLAATLGPAAAAGVEGGRW
jgi:hypothetical protein